jgi:hypothetical protein
MSKLRKEIISVIEQAIDVPYMDTYNISGMILEYNKEDTFTYWGNGKFTAISARGKMIGYLPKGDLELLNRVRELINLGWDNSKRQIPLDRTSWYMKKEHLRNMIMEL